MNKELFNIKTLSAGLLFIIFVLVFKLLYFDLIYDGFSRGYRYPVLIAEMIVFPLYFLGGIAHIASKIYRERKIDWSTVGLIAKYIGFFVFLFFVFFIMGIALN